VVLPYAIKYKILGANCWMLESSRFHNEADKAVNLQQAKLHLGAKTPPARALIILKQ